MPRKLYEDVRIQGHLIDSLLVPQIMDDIMDLEGEYEILSFEVGRTKTDISTAVLRVFGRDQAHLEMILEAIQEHGAVSVEPHDAELAEAPADGVFPDEFYSTTNLETYVRLGGQWVRVERPEMDCGVKVDAAGRTAETVPMSDVRRGDRLVVGRHGLRVVPLERPRESQPFEFMASAVSSEKPKAQIIHEVARLLRRSKEQERKIIAVVGPAVVHTGAPATSRASSSWATSTCSSAATRWRRTTSSRRSSAPRSASRSRRGTLAPGGHEHHLRAINTVRRCGGIRQAVEQGVLKQRPHVHAGDDRHALRARRLDPRRRSAARGDHRRRSAPQQAMRPYCQDAGACLMLSTMLHSIATGNLLPASVRTVCVDINPAVVTKLADRGSFQTIGIVTDVGLFLEQLVDEL